MCDQDEVDYSLLRGQRRIPATCTAEDERHQMAYRHVATEDDVNMRLPRIRPVARRAVARMAAGLPYPLLRRMVLRDAVVFCYHAVADEHLPHIRSLYAYKSIRQFEADLIFLKRHFELPTWEEFIADRPSFRRSGRVAAFVTFDDGLSSCVENVQPLLREHRVPCMFFITKAFVDNRQMFYRHKAAMCIDRFNNAAGALETEILGALQSKCPARRLSRADFRECMLALSAADEPMIDQFCQWLSIDVEGELSRRRPYLTSGEIRQLHSDGFTVGGHSVSHRFLGDLTHDDVEREIVDSCRFVGDLVGKREVPFAFPYSAYGVCRELLCGIVERNPWISMLFGTEGVNDDESFIMNRISADAPTTTFTGKSNLMAAVKASYARYVV
jgi:peptidoglycan/xylan/chitin deacetylase (PgdA/CDA1 family)